MVIKFGELFQEQISRKKLKNTDEVVFIGMQDVDENATIQNFTTLEYFKVRSGFTYFEKNDVLIAKITPCFENGKGGFADKIPTTVGFGSTEFHILRATENADARYIYYQTKRPKFRLALEGEMVGSAGHRRVPFSAIQNYDLEFNHSIKEQTTIANALSDVDALISALEKLIDKKTAIKTAAMQQLLTGKKRLPPFDQHHIGYKKTELGEIPEDWEVLEFGDVLKIRHGKSQKEIETVNGFYPILATGGEIGRTNTALYDKPSVLIGRKGTINQPRYMDSPFWTVDTLFFSEIEKGIEPKFVFYKFCIIDWMAYNEASGVPSLNASTIESVLQSFPTNKEEQTAIANVLSDMDTALNALQQRLAKTQQLKQGMMQELLTGKTRLI